MKKLICGNVNLFQEICPSCGELSLYGLKNPFCECGYDFILKKEKSVEYVCKAKKRRKINSKPYLKKQDNKCYWCGREIGSFLIRYNKVIILRVHMDHVLPYSFIQSNPKENYVASCHICNSFKSSKIFATESECRLFLLKRWFDDFRLKYIEEITTQE